MKEFPFNGIEFLPQDIALEGYVSEIDQKSRSLLAQPAVFRPEEEPDSYISKENDQTLLRFVNRE